jgi:hypothetical protein
VRFYATFFGARRLRFPNVAAIRCATGSFRDAKQNEILRGAYVIESIGAAESVISRKRCLSMG